VFNRLYEEHENMKRKKVRQQMDRITQEANKYSFMPDRVTKDRDSQYGLDDTSQNRSSCRQEVYDKLYKDAELQKYRQRERQMAASRELQELSRFSSISNKYSGRKFF